ncbi:MAG: DUF5711 family protein [Lachnospira sp.]
MADIISGNSRFNGDKKAPVKKVIQIRPSDYKGQEAATDELDEEEVKHRIRRHRLRVVGIAALIVVAIIVALFVIRQALDNYSYTGYTITNSVNREDIESSQYVSFGEGYIRYSNDGASYYTEKGKAIWNQTFSMQKPQVKICQDCIAVGDINGNTIYTFDKKGLIGKVDTSLSISQIEVGKQGVVVAVLEDNEANYINMYDKDGSKIYSVKTTLSGDGYPLDISMSEDSTRLMASYIYVSGEEIKTNVVFYNFSNVGKNETERVVGGFNHYDDTLVGDVQFINNNMAVAIGENVLSIYRIKEYPSLEKEIQIDNKIERVFYSDSYIGLVLDNSASGELYKLVVYNLSGNKVCETTFSTQYDDIQFDKKTIVMNNSSSFAVYNIKGKCIADIDFDMPSTTLLTMGERGRYILVGSKYIQNIKLK